MRPNGNPNYMYMIALVFLAGGLDLTGIYNMWAGEIITLDKEYSAFQIICIFSIE